MTSSNPPNFSRQILLLTAGIFLLVAPQAALAKHRHHSDGNKYAEKTKDTKQDNAANDGSPAVVTPPPPAPLPHPGTVTGSNPGGSGVIGGVFGNIAGALKPVAAGANTSTSTQPSGSGAVGTAASAIVDAFKPKTAGANTPTSTQH
jgi:hypothetical protein